MATPDDVQWFGWELHLESGNSDKFYRFLVTLHPDPAAVGLHGKRGDSGQIGLLKIGTDANRVISEVIDRTRDKEGKGYWLTRGFTPFTAPAALSDPGSLRGNAHTLAAHFGRAAVAQGTEEDNPAAIPTRPI